MITDTVPVEVIRETDDAYLLKDEESNQSWFPKQHVTVRNGLAVIPLWLLDQKGWNE